MTWRIAVSAHRFLPVDPENPVLNRIDAANSEVDERRGTEEERQASDDLPPIDPSAHVHLLAVPNEGMMAGQPTNCYLLGYVAGDAPLTLVDCGRREGEQIFLDAFEAGRIDPQRITRIVLTHCHPDHVGGAAYLKELTGAEVHAPPLEREQLERFAPELEVDHWLDHEQPVECEGFRLEPVFTPGHSPGHLAFVDSETRLLLAGDMISGFGSVGIFPPNGSVADYIDSLRRLLDMHRSEPFTAICPGHGPVIADAEERITWYINHRLQREREIVEALQQHGEPATTNDLLPYIYEEVLDHLVPAAKSTMSMHLQKLIDEGRVRQDGEQYQLT